MHLLAEGCSSLVNLGFRIERIEQTRLHFSSTAYIASHYLEGTATSAKAAAAAHLDIYTRPVRSALPLEPVLQSGTQPVHFKSSDEPVEPVTKLASANQTSTKLSVLHKAERGAKSAARWNCCVADARSPATVCWRPTASRSPAVAVLCSSYSWGCIRFRVRCVS